MTIQYAILPSVSGQTGLTARLFASEESDTVLYTSDSMVERTNALGQYRFAFGELAVIPAGNYFGIVTTGAGVVVSMGWRTFAGTDNETATTTIPTVVLDSATQTQITNIENAAGYTLAVLAGTCADPQTASETYTITLFGSTFTVDMAGQTSTGTRTAPTLTKS